MKSPPREFDSANMSVKRYEMSQSLEFNISQSLRVAENFSLGRVVNARSSKVSQMSRGKSSLINVPKKVIPIPKQLIQSENKREQNEYVGLEMI